MLNRDYLGCGECLEMMSVRLKELNSMIISLHMGLTNEHVEEQALDCIQCINYYINDIKRMADNCLEQYLPKQSNSTNK